jgi:hypothetical protein
LEAPAAGATHASPPSPTPGRRDSLVKLVLSIQPCLWPARTRAHASMHACTACTGSGRSPNAITHGVTVRSTAARSASRKAYCSAICCGVPPYAHSSVSIDTQCTRPSLNEYQLRPCAQDGGWRGLGGGRYSKRVGARDCGAVVTVACDRERGGSSWTRGRSATRLGCDSACCWRGGMKCVGARGGVRQPGGE